MIEAARIPSPSEIEQYRTPKGGWTRHDLEMWGVQWPPRDGWKEELEKAYRAGFTVGVVLECIACREMKFFVDYEDYPVCPECQVKEQEKYKREHQYIPPVYTPKPAPKPASFADKVNAAFQKPQKTYRKEPIPVWFRWAVWERDNFTCKHCGSRRNLSVDHIIPESKGGELTMENAQTLCKSCNSSKGAR